MNVMTSKYFSIKFYFSIKLLLLVNLIDLSSITEVMRPNLVIIMRGQQL